MGELGKKATKKQLNEVLTVKDWELREYIRKLNLLIDQLFTHDDSRTPTSSDDETKGFRVGHVWRDTTSNSLYVCKSNTKGSAVWAFWV